MIPPFVRRFLQRRHLPAVLPVLLGSIGMIRHFTADPDSIPAPPPIHQTSEYRAPQTRSRAISATGLPGNTAETHEMRRRLREFIIPIPGIKSLSLPEALALLQHHWQTLPHETETVPPAQFTLEPAALQQLETTTPPLVVSLEIPAVSLLTNLQLLAAQSDLTLYINESGAVLQPTGKPPDKEHQTATLSLPQARMFRFYARFMEIVYPHDNAASAATTAKTDHNWADGGYTIDLNLAPQVIEFEGFINYGSPIKTTGINALGQDEPVILTDSRVGPGVSAHNLQRSLLTELFTPMGLPDQADLPLAMAEPFQNAGPSQSNPQRRGYVWSSVEGTLTATGDRRTLRLASAVTAAILESTTGGMKVDFAAADWQNDQPPPEPAGPGSLVLKKSGNGSFETKPSSSPPTLNVRFGSSDSGPLPSLSSSDSFLLPEPGSSAEIMVEPVGARFLTTLTLKLFARPDISFSTNATPIPDHHWHRIDLPARADAPQAPRQSIFVRLSRTIIADNPIPMPLPAHVLPK